MLTEKITGGVRLYPPKTRNALIWLSLLLSVLFFIMIRYCQNGTLKMLLLYGTLACTMHLVIAYKNSINIYETGMFCFLCIQLFSLAPGPAPGKMDSIVETSYLLSYRYGVSSRSLAATIVDFLTKGGFISRNFVWSFIFCTTVFLSFIISVYIGTVIRKAKDETKAFLFFFSLLYISCFTSPAAYYLPVNFGRVEIFAFLFMLCLIAVIGKPVIRWIVPALALFTLAAHLILVFFYIPFIVIMLWYILSTNTEKQKSSVFLLVITAAVIVAGFLSYLLFHENTFVFHNAEDFAKYLTTKSDLDSSRLHMTLFARLEDHLAGWRQAVHWGFGGNVSIYINIPLIIMFIVFWIKCFLWETKKMMKFFFLLPILVLFYHGLAFFMFYDFGRWMIMVMNVQFMLVFYLVHTGNKTVVSVVQIVTPCINKNRFILILLCVLMASLGPVYQIGPSPKVSHIIEGIFQIFQRRGAN